MNKKLLFLILAMALTTTKTAEAMLINKTVALTTIGTTESMLMFNNESLGGIIKKAKYDTLINLLDKLEATTDLYQEYMLLGGCFDVISKHIKNALELQKELAPHCGVEVCQLLKKVEILIKNLRVWSCASLIFSKSIAAINNAHNEAGLYQYKRLLKAADRELCLEFPYYSPHKKWPKVGIIRDYLYLRIKKLLTNK